MTTVFGGPARLRDAGAGCLRECNPSLATGSAAKPGGCLHDGSAAINFGTPRIHGNKMANPSPVDYNNQETLPSHW